jgi:hypothetical protein
VTTEELIEHMREHGSSLIMNWGEDTAVWEVAWITSGGRFCGFRKQLRDALYAAHNDAIGGLGKIP